MKDNFKTVQLNFEKRSNAFFSAGARSGTIVDLDPFLNIDLFEMSEPTFPPHPHSGFSAVTYMLPESEGSFQNRDSFGDKSTIAPGDIHWTQAGSGMLHEEIPKVRGMKCKGFQIFINMTQAKKLSEPKSFHAKANGLPVQTTESGRLVVVSGRFLDFESPIREVATPVNIFDVTTFKNKSNRIELNRGFNWFAFVISGEKARLNSSPIRAHQILVFNQPETEIVLNLEAGQDDLRILLCGGTPIREPIVWGGPFAMTSREEIQAAFARYEQGKMGKLSPSF